MAKEGRNVLLVLDNATCHKHQIALENVKLSIIARVDDSANASQLAERITLADAVEWSKFAWRDFDSGLVVKYFASCGMTNSAMEKQIFSFTETNTVDEIIELSKIAGIEYDQKTLECEDNLECFDDLSDNWEERLI
ncbi:hypothetical protein AVEN_234839-1 [Araneus ventricosus]|uniref:DDE-1 domain-containing protein n=1 Tax=Araneus ventricosus TaxID=182803 RepID=A0A4Y2F4L4_ARAVE|nr:hypothetical protein AVEN_234839-1 [Araneus ventricosus]